MGIQERKEREFKRREKEILQAALRLFDGDDWELVTIERIAQEAEIGKGTVYLHFPSKEDIYGRLALDFARGVLVKLQKIDRGLPVLGRLRAAIRVIFDAHLAGRRYQRIVDYCNRDDFRSRLDEATRGELRRIDDEITALVMVVVQEGIAQGIFPAGALATALWGPHATLIGAVRMLSGNCGCIEPPDAETFIADVTRYMLAGLMFQERVPSSQ
ncbi:MAG TPA: TetR/AcrR family transcriptional regulator [Thermoanaerobaculia bacterium]|jgi:AcrR family transcriptional regulator|nr:TetR/AcrR family transcriptional regulator [Thermoanaerobaculia bacterium]